MERAWGRNQCGLVKEQQNPRSERDKGVKQGGSEARSQVIAGHELELDFILIVMGDRWKVWRRGKTHCGARFMTITLEVENRVLDGQGDRGGRVESSDEDNDALTRASVLRRGGLATCQELLGEWRACTVCLFLSP